MSICGHVCLICTLISHVGPKELGTVRSCDSKFDTVYYPDAVKHSHVGQNERNKNYLQKKKKTSAANNNLYFTFSTKIAPQKKKAAVECSVQMSFIFHPHLSQHPEEGLMRC